MRAVAAKVNLAEAKVADLMAKDVITCTSNTSLEEATEIMKRGRHQAIASR